MGPNIFYGTKYILKTSTWKIVHFQEFNQTVNEQKATTYKITIFVQSKRKTKKSVQTYFDRYVGTKVGKYTGMHYIYI